MTTILSIILLLLFCACNLSSTEKAPQKDSAGIFKKASLNIFTVDSIYLPFLPDTSLSFRSLQELLRYRTKTKNSFDSFSKRRLDTSSYSDSVKIANISASHHVVDLLDLMIYKFIKTDQRDKLTFDWVSLFSPYSQLVSSNQWLELFYMFPEELQNSLQGRNILTRIQETLYEKNNGYNMEAIKQLKVKDTTKQYLYFGDLLNSPHEYYLLMFGASWCNPCRLEEFQMKHWISAIDTSKVKLIALSIDTKENKWINYLKEDQNPWSSYLLDNGFDNSLIKQLQVTSIPRNFLINNKNEVVMEHADVRRILMKTPHVNVE